MAHTDARCQSSQSLQSLWRWRYVRTRRRSYQLLLFLAEAYGSVFPLALFLIDRGHRAPRSTQPYPYRPGPRETLVQRAQLGMLGEREGLEVVAAQATDAAPGRERLGVQ